jgi:colanic acid biosynthesis protein WcaH
MPPVNTPSDSNLAIEPKPGELLSAQDYQTIIRLAPLVTIDLIVRNPEGKVWLGWRKNQPAKGTWFVPGGRIRKAETRAAAFARITLAELGMGRKLEETTFLGAYDQFFKDNFFEREGFGTHVVSLAYEFSWREKSDPHSTGQHEECGWYTVEQIFKLEMIHPDTRGYFTAPP